MTLSQLEQRIATLEHQMSQITGGSDASPARDENAWIDQIHGTFKNDAAYRKAARLGRLWRKSSSPSKSSVAKKTSK